MSCIYLSLPGYLQYPSSLKYMHTYVAGFPYNVLYNVHLLHYCILLTFWLRTLQYPSHHSSSTEQCVLHGALPLVSVGCRQTQFLPRHSQGRRRVSQRTRSGETTSNSSRAAEKSELYLDHQNSRYRTNSKWRGPSVKWSIFEPITLVLLVQ